jgi:hypothetical protein
MLEGFNKRRLQIPNSIKTGVQQRALHAHMRSMQWRMFWKEAAEKIACSGVVIFIFNKGNLLFHLITTLDWVLETLSIFTGLNSLIS